MRHELHAVADAEDRNALIEKFFGDRRSLFLVHTGRTAGQDESLRTVRQNRRQRDRAGKNLRIYVRFANASCDKLRVLGAEIQDEDSIVPEFHAASAGIRHASFVVEGSENRIASHFTRDDSRGGYSQSMR